MGHVITAHTEVIVLTLCFNLEYNVTADII